ncbi:tetratricopeptide repeat protein 1 [Periophthalmus magnuspinnatus]|uniref:tetratricopeptide repeat protein 1 n=1 Tax=Periophthalmus magnuspinnatus TaxID=409849 RepID=UPI00145BBF43|nr:tetratricopeptide repeat protein 1 [Periophthalmus magnuspinnatus]
MEGKKTEKQDEEENFYDCEETLETIEVLQRLNVSEKEETKEEENKETTEERSERLREEPGVDTNVKNQNDEQFNERLKPSAADEGDALGATGGDEERTRGCTEEEAGSVEEEAGSAGEEEGAEFPSEQVQTDEEYLMELEKNLTDEEKEVRRQQSLSLKDEGNQLFKKHDWCAAESVYSEALSLCPLSFSCDRAVLYSNRGAARVHLGEKDKAIADCTKALELKPDYLKALLRRAELYEQTDKLDEALEDYKSVLERDPHNSTARGGAIRLPPLIHERNEKLKEEMMSKLKDLGNMILRPFGLSTSNFQLNQDQSTGAYNINFVQNPNNNNR